MPHFRLHILIFLLAVITLVGCRHTRNISDERPLAVPNADVSVAEPVFHCPYQYLSAAFECKAGSMECNGLLRTECDSLIWVSVSKIIEIGRVVFTPDSITCYLKIYNRYFKGSYEDLFRITGYQTSFDELQQQISDAYTQQSSVIEIPIHSKQIDITLTVLPRHADRLSTRPTFPLNIPRNAKVLSDW
ncbi:MAG: DUF4292 domain-containing protein [Bacteroidales bacterium]|nr:DUF4292 domain-containing protein [Candidatus Colimorpha onthohippi]